MKNLRRFYSADIKDFLNQENEYILGIIESNNVFDTTLEQSRAWEEEIEILKNQLADFKDMKIIFEYTIPRVGKRSDVILLYKNIVFVLEFKCGDNQYTSYAKDQVYDYALDLRDFHKESRNKLIVPILVSTEAPEVEIELINDNRIIEPVRANKNNIKHIIDSVVKKFPNEFNFDYENWENSEYEPTPTIVEAAQALYLGHNVEEISRNDAGAKNLSKTVAELDKIIQYSKENGKKSICFVSGVPGAGKTLVGLDLSIEHSNAKKGEHAVYLSGNGPLVKVLQEALARDKITQNLAKLNKKDALRETSSFIQAIHNYRDSFIDNNHKPPEHIVIFDEAQRAWDKEKLESFMKQKKGINNVSISEPEFLISTMDRQNDWGVIVCLIGDGQEIYDGEAGLEEWFKALERSFKDWDVYISGQSSNEILKDLFKDSTFELNIFKRDDLDLKVSMRSYRTPELSEFINALLEINTKKAKELYQVIKNKYPIRITRDITKAKNKIKTLSKGTRRPGLLASSKALRLKPYGIFVKNSINVCNWFLNDKEDVRSSYYLEDVVTEFDIQGLEIDYALVAWDADLRFRDGKWEYKNFRGNKWNNIKKEVLQKYLLNTYRVLLTRAREGMIIFIPEGDSEDETRKREFYDGTYNYLKSIGISEL